MKVGAESIFSSSIRSFCVAFFAILGICLSLMLFFLFVGGLFGSSKKGIPLEFKYEVLPNDRFERESLAFTLPVILQIDIEGVIGMDLNQQNVIAQLIESREGLIPGERVKAILLNINTPGGVIFDTATIYNAILDYKKRFNIPVFAFVDGLCASGGFYIACAADKIYTTPTSVIGSVGTVSEFFNVADLMEKAGVKNLTIAEGIGKDALNPFRVWKEGEDTNMKELGQFFYNNFLDVVTTARTKLKRDDLVNLYGAKIFPAPVAESYGYVDSASKSKLDVLKELAEVAKIDVQEGYQLIRFTQQKWLSSLFEGKFSNEITHHINIAGVDTRLMNKPLYLYTP
jgi:protease-4